jgi:hypothetical protein
MSSNSTERNQSAADIEKAEQAALAKTTPDEPLAVGGGPLLLEISNEVRFVVARLQQIFLTRALGLSQVGRYLYCRENKGAKHAGRLG